MRENLVQTITKAITIQLQKLILKSSVFVRGIT